MATTAVSRATDILTGTKRILAVDIPAGDKGSRLKRYPVADPYLRFWFRFVEPQLRNIEVGRSDLALRPFQTAGALGEARLLSQSSATACCASRPA